MLVQKKKGELLTRETQRLLTITMLTGMRRKLKKMNRFRFPLYSNSFRLTSFHDDGLVMTAVHPKLKLVDYTKNVQYHHRQLMMTDCLGVEAKMGSFDIEGLAVQVTSCLPV